MGMFATYTAILRDGRLEWESEAPPLPTNKPVRVQVTLMESDSTKPSGKRMADALERLAEMGGLQSFGDPLEWQREVRVDRALPGRDP
jgi:hypothetical protein